MVLYGLFLVNVFCLIALLFIILRDEKKRKILRDELKRKERFAGRQDHFTRGKS
jgi:hypothetical protein